MDYNFNPKPANIPTDILQDLLDAVEANDTTMINKVITDLTSWRSDFIRKAKEEDARAATMAQQPFNAPLGPRRTCLICAGKGYNGGNRRVDRFTHFDLDPYEPKERCHRCYGRGWVESY